MSWVQQPPLQQQQQQPPPQHYHQPVPVTQPLQHQQPHTHAPTTIAPPAFVGKTAPLPPPTSLPSSALNNAAHLQNHVQHATHHTALPKGPQSHVLQPHFNNQHQQQQQQTYTWQNPQQQPQIYQQQSNNKTMLPAPTSLNSWPQQQQQLQQQVEQQHQSQSHKLNNAPQSGYQQIENNWQQNELPVVAQQPEQPQQPMNMYDGYFTQEQPRALSQQPQKTPQFYQQNDLNAFPQQHAQQAQHQNNLNEFFDNSNNNNNISTTNNNHSANKSTDGWGDWGDWNDNNSVSSNDLQQQQQQLAQEQKPLQKQQQHQQPLFNPTNVIEDSFNTHNNNDTWQWNISENAPGPANAVPNVEGAVPAATAASVTPQVPTKQQQELVSQTAAQSSYQVPSSQQSPPDQGADYSIVTSKTAVNKPPTSLPLAMSEPTNDNYNNLGTISSSTATSSHISNFPNNIPSSVYVSQAKPVSRPSRQYASPPTGNTPSEASESALFLLTPPQAFTNDASMEQEALLSSAIPPTSAALPHTSAPLPSNSTSLPPSSAALPSASVAMPPPPAMSAVSSVAANPFKRAGAVQHHRANMISTATPTVTTTTPSSSFALPPPPPADFSNQASAQLEPDNSEILHENQEVITPPAPLPQNISLPGSAPLNAERNQYLQTSHLSADVNYDELNLEVDSLPPPGLSRLVLGQPELEATQRLVTGTEEPSISNVSTSRLDLEERHADGEDTSVDQTQNLLPLSGATSNRSASNVGAPVIAADRNLYQVPGESSLNNERRIIPGVETDESITLSVVGTSSQVRSEQREIELDGENLEDQQQPPAISRNEPPLEGAASTGGVAMPQQPAVEAKESRHPDKHHHSHQSKASSAKTHSNASTGNDSDLEHAEQHHSQRYKSTRNGNKQTDSDRRNEKPRREKQRSIDRSLGSEEASEEYSSDRERERRRGYREGSARSDRGADGRREAKDYQRRRERRDDGGGGSGGGLTERERQREKNYGNRRAEPANVSKTERSQRAQRHNRYDAEETEESTRQEANTANRKDYARRSTRVRGAQEDYDQRHDRSHRRSKREKDFDRNERRDDERGGDRRERRGERRGERDTREDYDTLERQRRRGEKHHSRDYEEYRKQSSRNARDSDLDKEQRGNRNGNGGQTSDPRFDPRMMYGYPTSGPYGMDYYYYEHLARTNPKAYSEYYKKYYEQQAMAAMNSSQQGVSTAAAMGETGAGSSSLAATDGRESVHSGRSSAHNDKERYTQAYISQANQYHRHYQQLAQFHPQQQQLQLQRLSANAYQSQNLIMNSTFHGDTASVASCGSYSRRGRLSAAQSVDNLSTISSQMRSVRLSSCYYAAAASAGTGNTSNYMGVGHMEYCADLRSGQLPLHDLQSGTLDKQRSTPCKFANLHAVVSISSGILVTVKPKITSKGYLSNIVKLQRLGINDSARQLFQAFPGPLIRGLTHKKTIIDFCEEQIRLGPTETTIYARQLTPRSVEKYRASYTLMWNLLILLLRQNGMVVGTDIAELLLKNQEQFPYSNDSAASKRMRSLSDDELSDDLADAIDPTAETKSNDEAISAADDAEAVNEDEAKSETVDSSTAAPVSQTLSEAEITDKFRNYLLYGNVNEALEWATDNNLWGHALFLASKVDRRSHANVMMKFANKLSLNDPLQTLYQLMSGRTPSSVTSVQDEKWGDWRPHLSMILSNTSQKPELIRKAITSLGDSLFNRGDLYASHFCYLMAQVGFGRYQESAVQETSLQQNLPKLILLGSSHYKNFRDFATNEAIMMTEIYEYACSLNDEKFSLVEFQPYKYLLATRLLDYGYDLRSLMYMEQISLHVAREPSRYDASFINKVYEIADRLKYVDPVLEKSIDDSQNLDGQSNVDLQNTLSHSFEEQKWLQNLRSIAVQYKLDYPVPTASYPSHDYAQQQQDSNYMQNQINQEFAEINKQFSELNLQYTSGNLGDQPNMYSAEAVQQQPASMPQESGSAVEQQQHQDFNLYQTPSLPSQMPYGDYGNTVSSQQPSAAVAASADNAHADAYAANYAQQQQPEQQQQNAYYDPNVQAQYEAYSQQNVAGYGDYWAQQQQQQHDSGEPNITSTNKTSLETGTSLLSNNASSNPTKAHDNKIIVAKKSATLPAVKSKALQSNTSTTTRPLKTFYDKPFTLLQKSSLSQQKRLYNTPTKPTTTAIASKSLKIINNNEQNHKNEERHVATVVATQEQPTSPFLPDNVSNIRLPATALAMPLGTQQHVAMTAKSCESSVVVNAKSIANNKLQAECSNLVATSVDNAPIAVASPPKSSLAAALIPTAAVTQKRVIFDLPATVAEIDSTLESASEESIASNATASITTNAMLPYNALATGQKSVFNSFSSTQKQQQMPSPLSSSPRKNIVFNGTFPIDMPLRSRFKYQQRTHASITDYDPEANVGAAQLKYDHMLSEFDMQDIDEEDEDEEDDEYDEDDDDEDDDDDGFDDDDIDYDEDESGKQHYYNDFGVIRKPAKSTQSRPLTATTATSPHQVWSMQELIKNPTIPLNYQKMCNEVEQSLAQFERYLDSKSGSGGVVGKSHKAHAPKVRTFDIDCPIEYDYYQRGDFNADGSVSKAKKNL